MNDTIILAVRIIITLTFLILAIGGPIAILKLNRFIKIYLIRHAELTSRIERVEQRVPCLEGRNDG